MVDNIINTMTIIAILLIAIGLLIAIWFGFEGIKIAGSGVVLIFTAMALSYCNEEIKLEKEEKRGIENV